MVQTSADAEHTSCSRLQGWLSASGFRPNFFRRHLAALSLPLTSPIPVQTIHNTVGKGNVRYGYRVAFQGLGNHEEHL